MFLINLLCAALALLLAGIASLVFVPLMVILGSLHKILLSPWANPAWIIGRAWYHFMHFVCVRGLLRVKVQKEVYMRKPVTAEDHIVWVGNHPSMMAIPSVFSLFVRCIKPELLAVSKMENQESLSAFAAWAVDGWIYIDRDDRASALPAISEGVKKSFTPSRALVVFPDSSRPTQEKIRKARDKIRAHVPNIDDVPSHTLPWRIGGIVSALKALDPLPYRMLRVSNGFNVPDEGRKDIMHIIGSTLLFRLDEIDAPDISDEQACADWANKNHAEVNHILDSHRS